MFEPNAFDGKDSEYIDTAYGTKLTGRISFYFFKYNRDDVSWQSGIEDVPESDFVQEYYTLALGKKVPVVTDPYIYAVTHGSYPMITISAPIFDHTGKANGVFTSDIFLDKFFSRLENVKNFNSSYMVLTNNYGTIVYSPIAEQIGKKAADEGIAYASFPGEISFSYQNSILNDNKILMATGMIQLPYINETYTFSFAAPLGEINTSINRLIYPLTALLVIMFILLMSVVYYFLSRLSVRTLELEKQTHATMAASKAKTDFLARMSHEMRTPLNAVIGLSGVMLDAVMLDAKDRSNLENIYNAGSTLLSTVNDILDISKIEADKLELVNIDYDMPSLINDVVMQNSMRIGEKDIELKLDIHEDLYLRLHGDELRIKQIMSNLLSNAIKYTEKGTVELGVRCARENDSVWLTIQVSDTGKGIKSEHIGQLFSDYFQLEIKANRGIEGTGLGLPIIKRLAELMGGSVSVQSEYGKGSVFTVKLMQKFVSDIVIGSEVVESIKGYSYTNAKRDQKSQINRISLPYAHVLIVDDIEVNLDVAKEMMKQYGMQIDCVTSGQQAIDAVRAGEVSYNAIFMDHMMPGMDGIEATERIRKIDTEYARKIPIIALTANAIVGNEELFLSKGFQAFLSKPIDIFRLDEVIRNWVRDKSREETFAAAPNNENKPHMRRLTDRRSGIERRKKDQIFAGLNISEGINRFGGDEESYMNILRSYAVNTRPILVSLENAGKDDLGSYAITVHGLKGASRGIFADMIAASAEKLEYAAKTGDYAYVLTHNQTFLDAAGKLVKDLEDMFSRTDKKLPKPQKDRPDADLIKKLLAACKAYDIDEADTVISEMGKYEYLSDGDLADWLIENVKLTNFKEIIEKLSDSAE